MIVAAPPRRVWAEAVRWGESPWWPDDALARFVRLDAAHMAVNVGSRYRFEVRRPGFGCEVRVTDCVPLQVIEREFRHPAFTAVERVVVRAQGVETRLEYDWRLTRMAWWLRPVWRAVRRAHDREIRRVLISLKGYCETSGRDS